MENICKFAVSLLLTSVTTDPFDNLITINLFLLLTSVTRTRHTTSFRLLSIVRMLVTRWSIKIVEFMWIPEVICIKWLSWYVQVSPMPLGLKDEFYPPWRVNDAIFLYKKKCLNSLETKKKPCLSLFILISATQIMNFILNEMMRKFWKIPLSFSLKYCTNFKKSFTFLFVAISSVCESTLTLIN